MNPKLIPLGKKARGLRFSEGGNAPSYLDSIAAIDREVVASYTPETHWRDDDPDYQVLKAKWAAERLHRDVLQTHAAAG